MRTFEDQLEDLFEACISQDWVQRRNHELESSSWRCSKNLFLQFGDVFGLRGVHGVPVLVHRRVELMTISVFQSSCAVPLGTGESTGKLSNYSTLVVAQEGDVVPETSV